MKDGVIQQLGTPDEVFFRPQNKYVASFIGSPRMNFFDVTIEPGRAVARLADIVLPLDGYAFSTSNDAPGRAELGIRPEHIDVVAGDGPGGMKVAVELVEPMGSESVIWARLNDVPLSLVLQGDKRLRVGETIRIAFPGRQLNLFDAALGTRL
jgi:multiple sugar transport system ATP-binding protein